MKIKSIAAICKKNKQVVLFNRYSDSGTISQYIGDGSAVYPISGLPELDEESILTIFDVPEKQREDWLVRYLSLIHICTSLSEPTRISTLVCCNVC